MSNIYFISDGASIKIGRSKSVGARFRSLEIGNPNDLQLIACVDGGSSEEKAIHRELEQFRLRGEWFADCAQVREAIDRYRTNGAPSSAVSSQSDVQSAEMSLEDMVRALEYLSSEPDRLGRLCAELESVRAERIRLEAQLAKMQSEAV
jgi:hypothetical protein